MKTLERMIKVLSKTSIYDLWVDAGFDLYSDDTEQEYSDEEHPLMFDLDKNKFFFLNYGTPNDGWVKIAEQQNPWMYICYLTAESADNYPDEYIEECINNYFN